MVLAVNAKNKWHLGKVRVCSINATTGLEAPIVFIAGLDRIFAEEAALEMDPEDRPDMILRNTRKVYMALTRAMSRLVICFCDRSVRGILTGTAQKKNQTRAGNRRPTDDANGIKHPRRTQDRRFIG